MIFAFSLGLQVFLDSQLPQAKDASQNEKTYQGLANSLKSLELTDSKGKLIKFDGHFNDLVLINFWASWCQPCLEEIPSLVQFSKSDLGQKVVIIGINGDEESAKAKATKLIEKSKMNFSNVWDFDGKIFEKLNVSAVPVTVLFKKGEVLKIYREPVDFEAEEFKLNIKNWLSL